MDNSFGQGKSHETSDAAYDAEHGTYDDHAVTQTEQNQYPQTELPKAPEPSPFKIGPMEPGGR